jgi:hypothetical protein
VSNLVRIFGAVYNRMVDKMSSCHLSDVMMGLVQRRFVGAPIERVERSEYIKRYQRIAIIHEVVGRKLTIVRRVVLVVSKRRSTEEHNRESVREDGADLTFSVQKVGR